jgi:hypothetical protein
MRQHVSPIAPDAIRAIFSTSTTGVVVAVVAGAIIRIPNAGPMVCFWVAAKLEGNVRAQVRACRFSRTILDPLIIDYYSLD